MLYLKENVLSSALIVLPSLICLKIMFKVVNTAPVKLLKTTHVTGLKMGKKREKR